MQNTNRKSQGTNHWRKYYSHCVKRITLVLLGDERKDEDGRESCTSFRPRFLGVSWLFLRMLCMRPRKTREQSIISAIITSPSISSIAKTRTRATLGLSWKSSRHVDDIVETGWRHVTYFGDMRTAERRDPFVQHILCVDYSYFLTSHTLIDENKYNQMCSETSPWFLGLASASHCRIPLNMSNGV
jgi:hypothetical protein